MASAVILCVFTIDLLLTRLSLTQIVAEAFKSLFKQSDYNRELEEKLNVNLQEKANAFSAGVTHCLHRMVQATHHNVLAVGRKVGQVDKSVHKVGGDVVSAVDERIVKLRLDALNSLEEQLYGLSKDVEGMYSPFSSAELVYDS